MGRENAAVASTARRRDGNRCVSDGGNQSTCVWRQLRCLCSFQLLRS